MTLHDIPVMIVKAFVTGVIFLADFQLYNIFIVHNGSLFGWLAFVTLAAACARIIASVWLPGEPKVWRDNEN